MDDLVKMLRDRHDYYLSGLTEKQNSLLSLAADEIESLRQQLAECERERDELKQWLEDQVCEAKDFAYKLESKTIELATVTKERDELKQSDTYWRNAYNESLGREINLNDGLEAVFEDIEVITPNRDYGQMSPKDCYELGLMDGAMAVRNNVRSALAKLGADKTGEVK